MKKLSVICIVLFALLLAGCESDIQKINNANENKMENELSQAINIDRSKIEQAARTNISSVLPHNAVSKPAFTTVSGATTV